MATLTVSNTYHASVGIDMEGLQVGRNEYDKFVFRFSQNGRLILAFTWNSDSSTYPGFLMTFSSEDYLGNNWFAPATTYSITVDCYYKGVAYPVGPVAFTTDAVAPPSGSISPLVYPTVKNQGTHGNCVAMALSTAMEIFKASAVGTGGSYENFSISYIFGSDGQSYDYMMFEDAINLCEAHGSPRWELVTTAFPDSKSKAESVRMFNGASGLATNNAMKQAFTGHKNIDLYDCAAVASAIRNHGCFIINFRVPNNFYTVPSTGIVPQPSGGYNGANHSLALIGLTTKNGKPHWIAQNGWGTPWGNGGRCYIPYDWGCGVQSPQGAGNSDQVCGWTCDCYSVWNYGVSNANPSAPTNLSATQNGKETSATMRWSLPTAGSATLVYARKRNTTDWWPKPTYGSPFMGTSGQISFDADTSVYELMAIAVKDNLLSQQSEITTVSISLLELWSWLVSNGTATATQTKSAYTAVTSRGETTGFSYKVWNDLVEKVNEAAVAAGDTWSTTYATLAQTKMTSSDKVLTAKRFNALRHNIGMRVSTGISEVRAGDSVNGNYFITLADKLNNWIGRI